jgi:general secretion pathway protein M
MIAFWAARSPRERALLSGLALICLVYLGFVGLWRPLQGHRDRLMADIARFDRTAAALSEAVGQGAAFAAPTAGTPLPQIVTDTAAAYQLTIRRLQPTDNAAEITLEEAAFDAVLPWIEALERDHALRILTLTMTRRPEPGLIATTLTVGR